MISAGGCPHSCISFMTARMAGEVRGVCLVQLAQLLDDLVLARVAVQILRAQAGGAGREPPWVAVPDLNHRLVEHLLREQLLQHGVHQALDVLQTHK